MLENIITWSLNNRFLVIVFTLLLIGSGVYSFIHLPMDAFPDTTPVQVQINTVVPALSPVEIEQQVTFPIEQTIGGLPRLIDVRSISKFGLSQVTVIFEDGTDIYFARQLVMERLQSVELPEGISQPEMGPVATGLGEIYHYIVTGKGKTLEELTTIHDWVIKPRLRSVPGVAEVNTWGGERKQYHVLVDPMKLVKFDLMLSDVFDALGMNNFSVGGGNISQAGEMHLVRGISLTSNVEQIANIVITTRDSIPVRIRDIAKVEVGHEIRQGAVTANGNGEVVLGLGFMLMGENSHEITKRLKFQMGEIVKTLPEGVEIRPVYERTELVNMVLETVKENLLLGAIFVIAVLLIFLGDLKAGLIVAATIPLSLLFAFNWMLGLGVAGSLMSLGAIDFGFIVDSCLVMVDNTVRNVATSKSTDNLIEVVRKATIQVARPTIFSQAINMIVYLPILTLQGIEGRLFAPMSLAILFVLSGSIILLCTIVPVLLSLFVPRSKPLWKDIITPALVLIYRPMVILSQRYAKAFIFLPIIALCFVFLFSSKTGSTFIPRLSEMGIVINTVRLSGTSLEESVRYGTQIEKFILDKYPDEVRDVWIRTGTAEVATDPMGIELSDIFIMLKPRKDWVRADNQDELSNLLRDELSGLPGMRMVFTQPIEMRVNEMIAGIRTDLGVKIFGDDLEKLKEIATDVDKLLKSVPGSADIYTEQVTGLPILEIEVNQDAIARYGIPAKDVLDVVETIGVKTAGEIREGQQRFELAVRLDEKYRNDPAAIGRILISSASGEHVTLDQVASIRQVEGPSIITREWQKRRIVVQCNVTGRDISGFVDDVRRTIDRDLNLPAGYHVTYGGQFEHLERARTRLLIVVPLALLLIFFLLHASTGTVRDSLIIFVGIIFATFGGLVAIMMTDLPFTISAGVGFVVASGVSVLNGLVMISTIKDYLREGMPFQDAVREGAILRLRPILMAGIVAILGFLPMATSTGVGAEVQRPLATVVIGAIICDNLLMLIALPALYTLFGSRKA